jgi:hypothetical protein
MRSLEEFRKNSHAKIPSKSPCTNFQSCPKKFEFQKKMEKGLLLVLGLASVFGPAVAHLHFLSPTGHFPPPFPVGPRPLGRPVGLVGHVLVVPCPLAASLTGRRLQPHRLYHSPRSADRWAPPVIPHLWLCPSSAAPPPPPATPRAAQLHTTGCRPEPLLAPPSLRPQFPPS